MSAKDSLSLGKLVGQELSDGWMNPYQKRINKKTRRINQAQIELIELEIRDFYRLTFFVAVQELDSEYTMLTTPLNGKALSVNKVTFNYKTINKIYQAENKMYFTVKELINALLNFRDIVHNDLTLASDAPEYDRFRRYVKIQIVDNKPDNLVLRSIWYQ